MEENYTKILYSLDLYSEEKIKQVPLDFFKSLGAVTKWYDTGSMQNVSPRVWLAFTENQLLALPVEVLVTLNEDVLLKLYEKFKNNEKTGSVEKTIKDKTVEIMSQPVKYKILKAIEFKQNLQQRMDKVKECRKIIALFNQESDNALIPAEYISSLYVFYVFRTQEDLRKLFIKKPSKEELNWGKIQDHIQFTGIYENYIRKGDLLRYLEGCCEEEIHLTEIPYILRTKTFCEEYDIVNLNKRMRNYLIRNKVVPFRIRDRFYFNYEDLIIAAAKL